MKRREKKPEEEEVNFSSLLSFLASQENKLVVSKLTSTAAAKPADKFIVFA